MKKEKYGQYMTPENMAEFMVSLIDKNKKSKILEPSSGDGVFIKNLKSKGFDNIDAYEIDKELYFDESVKNESFVSAIINEKYDVVIGNPPYIRWKNLEHDLKNELLNNNLFKQYLNSLNDYSAFFILKSVELLKEGGELIFITPDYWMSTTQSKNLRNYLINNGYFSDIFLFKETPVFNKVNVSLTVFKFIKSYNTNKPKINIQLYDNKKGISKDIYYCLLNKQQNDDISRFEISNFTTSTPWYFTDSDKQTIIDKYEAACKNPLGLVTILEDVCDIDNGMVSGLDKAFQIEGDLTKDELDKTIKILKAKNIDRFIHSDFTRYIFLNEISISEDDLIQKYPNFYNKLSGFKNMLLKRYNYGRDIKYWEWVFLRNYNSLRKEQRKIMVPCKERVSNKDYLRFTIAENDIYPTQDVTAITPFSYTEESLEYICAILNSKYVYDWVTTKGIIKGNIVEFSKKPTASIPFRKIDFTNKNEVEIHNKITILVQEYIEIKDWSILIEINKMIDRLI